MKQPFHGQESTLQGGNIEQRSVQEKRSTHPYLIQRLAYFVMYSNPPFQNWSIPKRRKRLFFLVLAFLLVVILILSSGIYNVLTKPHPGNAEIQNLLSRVTIKTTSKPVLTVQGTPPAVGAKASYLLDGNTGNVLADTNGQEQLPMASTTKIMTALIALQAVNLNQVITIQQDAIDEVNNYGGSSAHLVAGDQLSLKDLLYALMLPSGDDAAIAIADAVAGSSTNFVDEMNQYAQSLHLAQTHYINPDGLTYTGGVNGTTSYNYTSAADLVRLTQITMKIPLFAQIVKTQEYIASPTANHRTYDWVNTNNLLNMYSDAVGVKTGFTLEAGYCLVFSAIKDGQYLIGAVLNDSTIDPNMRFTDAIQLLNWGFALPLRIHTTR